ncbi:hypothetical protein BS47DRAFT_1365381 [Hydnum rufescens UP504]|uniref:Uncharacterized protein n=1 Tax=Hydnum rufescens UP504 TaxID=1448309 RepID=A0A9P6AP15_9AGAM|nr:hypothetical protein BS47DRAFT_1365381 [Hydnum rufescens UP504]
MSGLEEAMNNERNPKDLARLEAERAMRLEARQARAAEMAEEHTEKGKETEVEADDEAKEEEFDEAHTKPLVSRLTKSQTKCVKQQAEEERERYAALAHEMQVPTELVLQTAHAPNREIIAEGLGTILPGSTLQRILTMAKASKEGKEGYKMWARNISIQLEEIEAKVNWKTFSGSSRAPILKKLGKDLSEKSLPLPKKLGILLNKSSGHLQTNGSLFLSALNLTEAETFEPLIKGWEAYAEANPLEDLHSTVSGKLLEMANRVLKQNGVLESWAKKGWPYVGIVVGFVKGAHSRQEGYPLVIPGTILYMEAFSRESVNVEDMEDGNLPLVFDQKKNPLLHLWDSTKWRKMDAAQKAKEGKNRAKMNKALWDTGGKSSAIVNVVSSDLEDTPPSFREASDDGSGAEIAPQRSSKTKLSSPRTQEPRKMAKSVHKEADLNQGAAGMPLLDPRVLKSINPVLAKRRHPAKNQTWAVVKEGVNPLIGGRMPP